MIARKALLEEIRNGKPLQDVPMELRDREICLEAVKRYGEALGSIPDELRDREMCMTAVRQVGCALRHVPEDLCDHEICLAAVKQTGWALRDVPTHLRDMEICCAAARQDKVAMNFFPNGMLDRILQKAIAEERPPAENEKDGFSSEKKEKPIVNPEMLAEVIGETIAVGYAAGMAEAGKAFAPYNPMGETCCRIDRESLKEGIGDAARAVCGEQQWRIEPWTGVGYKDFSDAVEKVAISEQRMAEIISRCSGNKTAEDDDDGPQP